MTDVVEDRGVHPSAVALMDAVDQLLGEVGYSGISSRRITDLAGLAHGSIRYHFGSLQGLLVATLGRRNEAMYVRQATLYDSGHSTLEIWRRATREHLEEDLQSGWALRVVEAILVGIRDPEAGRALSEVLEPWRELMHQATHRAVEEYGLDLPNRLVDGIAALIETSQMGMMVQRLAGNDKHHDEALDAVDALLGHLENRARSTSDGEAGS